MPSTDRRSVPLVDAFGSHLAARGGAVRLTGLLVVATLAVLAAQERVVLLPWTSGSSIALDPIAPAAYLLPAAALVETRRFTLEPVTGRERGVRLLVLGALLVGVVVCLTGLSLLSGREDGLLAWRGALFFLGTTLLLARTVDVRLAASAVSVLAWVIGWLGSPGGPLTAWSWLAFPVDHAGAWALCAAALTAGVLVDVSG